MTELNKYHFYASIVMGQAFVIKNLIDLLATNIRGDGQFKFTQDGIYVRSNDSKLTTLISAYFPRKAFGIYKCDEEEMYIGANLINLQNSMKTVKRKERMALYILKGDEEIQNKLCIEISPLKHEPMEHQKKLTFKIQIFRVYGDGYKVDDQYYHHPIIIKTSDYQNMSKTLNSIGKITTIEIQDSRWIKFSADGGKIIDATLIFGDQEAEPENPALANLPPYRKDFETTRLNGIIKLTSMTNQIQISAPNVNGFPIKFQIEAGNLGTITVHLKDREAIQIEADMERNKKQKSKNIK